MVSEEKSGPIRIHDKHSVFLGTEFQSQEKQTFIRKMLRARG